MGAAAVQCAECRPRCTALLDPEAGCPAASTGADILLQQAPCCSHAATHGRNLAAAAGPPGELLLASAASIHALWRDPAVEQQL